MCAIIGGCGTGYVRQMLRALHTPEVDEWIVGLPTSFEPLVPIVAPFAANLEVRRQPVTTRLVDATAVIIVAIEVAAGVPWELSRTSVCEDALPCPRNLEVKAVITVDIVPNVRDLHHHTLANQIRVRAAPIPIRMFLVHEFELVALAAVRVTLEAMATADCYCRKAHAQPSLHEKGLVVGTRGGRALTTAN